MKRKMTALLTVVLMLAMLAGCGNSSQTTDTATVGSASDSASGTSKETASSTGGTLSECLSTEKVIAYEVDTVDKSETPDNIYFFENGKVTIIPGEEFGLTMGDFAQMTDEEIWSTYETVRETYIENYKTQKVSEYASSKNEEIRKVQSAIDELQNIVTELSNCGDDRYTIYLLVGPLVEAYSDGEEYDNRNAMLQKFSLEEITVQEGIDFFTSEANNTIAKKTTSLTQLQAELDAVSTDTCPVPFSDIPFKFVVETDASGNNAQSESLVYPTLEYLPGGEAPDTLYDSLGFALGLTTEQQIYDTTYNCIALSGSGRFCTRETMETDTIDSKNVLVDLSKDEINELFKEEVMARYE